MNVGTFTPGPWKVRAATFCDDGIPSYEVVMPGKPVLNAIDARLIGKSPELYLALERTLANFKHLLAGRPVRDATETIAEAEHAMDLEFHAEISK